MSIHKSQHQLAYILMSSGLCLYVLSDAIMKSYLDTYSINQIVFLRTLFRIIPYLFVISILKINPLKTNRKFEHIFRALLASSVTYCFISAYKYTSMTNVAVIGYTTALFVLPLSALILREKMYIHNVIIVLTGFIGVLIIFKPEYNIFQSGITISIVGAFFAALNQTIIRKLSITENEFVIIFYHHIILIFISFMLSDVSLLFIFKKDLALLFLGGIVGACAQYCLIRAFKLSETSILASANYLTLIPIILLDFFIWNKFPTINAIIGSILILISSYHASKIQNITKK